MRELTIIIPYFNGDSYIDNLIKSIPDNIPVIIIDDLSDKPLNVKKENVTVYRLQQKGYFTGACNQGIKLCDTDVLILNQDVILSDGWQEIIEQNRDEFAMIGEKIKGNHPLFHHGYAHGTFYFMRRDAINDVGLFNEELYPLWGSNAEWQLRSSRKGYKVLPLAKIPGFTHLRHKKEAYGDSIKQTLKTSPQAKKQLIKTPPEISVIIPCHNYGKYLQDSVNSLIGGETCLGKLPGQTMQSFEVIIVDDGSNEENQQIINSYVTGWNGVRVVRLDRNPIDENGKYIGKPSALNAGINKAIGKYITVLDADDMMDSRRLYALWKLAEENPHSVIYDQILSFKNVQHKIRWHNEKSKDRIVTIDTSKLSLEQETIEISKKACELGRHTVYGDKLAFYFWPLPDYNFDEMLYKNCMHAGIFFTKQAWVECGGYNEQMIYGREDWCMNIALGERGYCGIKANQPFYLYRREGQNRTLENTKPEWQKIFSDQLQTIYKHLYNGERPMACCGRGSRPQQNKSNNNNLAPMSLTNQDGLTYVKYVGSRSASFSTWGASTGIQYRVNPKNPVFLVDNDDLYTENGSNKTGILDIYEGNKYAFELYVESKPVVLEKIDSVEVSPMGFDFEDKEESLQDTFEDETITELTDKHLSAFDTVAKLREFMLNETFSLEELNLMLEYEKTNKNRVSAIDMIEMNIDQYDGSTLIKSSDVQNY